MVAHQHNVGQIADLAANSGLYQTEREQFHDGLQADASARAADAQGQHAYATILQDMRQREINATNDAARRDIASAHDQNRLATTDMTVNGANDRNTANNETRVLTTDMTVGGANARNTATIDGANARNTATNDTRVLTTDMNNTAAAAKGEADRAQRAAQWQAQMDAKEAYQRQRDYEAKVAREGTQRQRADLAKWRADQQWLMRELQMNEARAKDLVNPDPNAAGRVGELTGQIRKHLLDSFGNPQAPAMPAPTYDEAGGYPAPQQQAPPPQSSNIQQFVPDRNGTIWRFTGQFDPQTGEAIYMA